MVAALLCLLALQPPPDTLLPFAPKPVIDTLCSAAFFGRGYQKKGAEKAADYIAQKLERAGVSSAAVSGTYKQPFSFLLNQVEGEPTLTIGITKGILGKDFLPDATSPSARLKLVAEPYDSTTWIGVGADIQKNSALIFSTAAQYRRFLQRKESGPGLAFVKHTKLPAHTLSEEVAPFPTIYVTDNFAPRSGERVIYRVRTAVQEVQTANVLGMVMGTARRDSFLVVGAHYDHLGGLGSTVFFPGANDNATGTAMVLELAAYVAKHPMRYTVIFAFFSGEEAGLRGSRHFVENPSIPLERIRFMLNLDLLGSGEDGATLVNAPAVQPDFEKLQGVNVGLGNALPTLRPRRNAPNSDHYPFTEEHVPAMFMYLQGPFAYYHSIEDKPRAELTLAGFNGTFKLCRTFLHKLASGTN
jgi:hypothetical protein